MSKTNNESGDRQSSIASEKAASIHTKNLTHEYNTEEGTESVFEDINLDIEPGSFVTLLGKSGSGKSTMLKIFSGIIEPTSGEIQFLSENGDDDVTIGQVFQEPRLLPWDTCIDNIELVHENNPDFTENLAMEYLDMVSLSDHYNKYPTRLSGGQKQRVGIARALSIDPEVLLMDEPFSDLDEITAEELRRELTRIWADLNKTVFFVTHNMTEAIQLSDRILMLGDGGIYGDIEISLDRPRDLDSAEFMKIRNEAIETFYSIEDQDHGEW